MQSVNRIEPELGAGAFQTYEIRAPRDVRLRSACEQTGCPAWRQGWESVIDESTPLGQGQAAYIRTRSGRTFREQKNGAGLTVFRFESGQRCFAEHRTRPDIYLVRDGDWRGNPTGRQRQHTRPEDWVEDMAGSLDAVRTGRERG
ncbi:hypothetical protein ACGFY9_13885 [Streptomyces sp. NPDC048504]|uniref:hypothetical protein n=1 Tax=Streptomyces sp. NPDC048504 TaxID=3365559 RepID=UPI003713FE3C